MSRLLQHLQLQFDIRENRKLLTSILLSFQQTNTMNESPKDEHSNDKKKIRPKGRKYSEEKADIFIVELDQLLDEAETHLN